MTYAIILLTSFLFYYALRQYRFYIYRKYEFKLFALRDKLRDYAIDNKVNKSDWTFKYFDSSISKMITQFKAINLYHALFLFKTHDKDKNILTFVKKLDLVLDKNEHLKEINNEYTAILNSYIIHRHLVLIIITALGIKSAINSVKFLRKLSGDVKDSIKNLSVLPETSTSMEYYKHVPALIKC